MELRHLRYFVAVAEELNFTRAAERLGMSQPPLSAQIRDLETELGSQLLNRRARGVELTNAGKLLLEESRLILKQVEVTRTSVRRRARAEMGRLIVGSAGGTYFHPLVPEIIREYGKRFPDIVMTPQASNTCLLIARLRADKIDLAFVWPPIGDDSGLVLEPLVSEEAVIVLPASHALAGSKSLPLAALASEVFVMYPRELNPGNYDAIIAACRGSGFDPPLGQESPQIVSVIPMVAAGLGVSIVPRSMSRMILSGHVRFVAIEGSAPRAEMCLARRRRDTSKSVKDFVLTARRLVRAKTTLRDEEPGPSQAPAPLPRS